MNERTSLYRHFDENGTLLYVGISGDIFRRTAQHDDLSAWFWNVARIDVEHHATRASAISAEGLAIESENPLYNIRASRVSPLTSMDEKQASEVERLWHCGVFLTSGIIAYCKSKLDVRVTRHDLVAFFGRSEMRRDMTHEEMAAAVEYMR